MTSSCRLWCVHTLDTGPRSTPRTAPLSALRVVKACVIGCDVAWPRDSGNTVMVTNPVTPGELRSLAARARAEGVPLALGVETVSTGIAGATANQPVTIAVLSLPQTPPRASASSGTRALDLAVTAVLAPCVLPLLLVAVVAIVLDSPGSPLFAQVRIGRAGRPFRLWKLRTMHHDAAPDAPSPRETDPRVTRVGRLLRSSGLDELPQLFNVIVGDMRLVGPRPEMMFIADGYTALERERLAVRPGLTGLWQLRGDRSRAIHAQVSLDLYYIAFRTHWLDLQLLAATVPYVLRGLRRALTHRYRPSHD